MRKKKLFLIVLMIIMAVSMDTVAFAQDSGTHEFDMTNKKFIEEYTENGVHIVVYEIISDTPEIMPRFPVYKEIGIWQSFDGWDIVPPPTYSYKIENDPDFHTYMSGTLYLKETEKVVEGSGKRTHAYYKGTIAGNI